MGALVEGAKINDYHNEGRILAFKLGGAKPIPQSAKRDLTPPPMPAIDIDESLIAAGEIKFNEYCAVCHGVLAMSSNLFPDLRYTVAEKHTIFKEIVVDGALVPLGMPSFGDALNADDANAIQMYVLEQARIMREPPVEASSSGP